MRILNTRKEIISLVTEQISKQKTIGFVPTMGALHKGHLSLIERAKKENDIVVVSIFVNPTQFDNATDLEKYPRTLDNDARLIQDLDPSIIIFSPNATELYKGNIVSKSYSFDGLEHEMEGKHRDGHFDGVGTVLELFFTLITPHRAYFGEKDFQQLRIVQKLVSKLQLNVIIIPCKIFREASGLAMSSRNERLSIDGRIQSSFIYETLIKAKELFGKKSANFVKQWVEQQFEAHSSLDLEYVEIANTENLKPVKRKSKTQEYRIFIAAYIDNIRLIDNIALN